MRIKFINRAGGITYVDETRKDEYIKAGFVPAEDVEVTTKVEVVEPSVEKKTTRKRR